MAAAAAFGRLVIRARTAAVSAGRSSVGSPAAPRTDPEIGSDSTPASAESTAASTHTAGESRRTGTPESRARSMFSAAPLIPRPARVPFSR